jgi:hypothetical protein
MLVTAGLLAACALRPGVAAAQSSPFLLTAGSRVQLEYKDSVRLVPIGVNRHRLTGVLLADSAGAYQLRLPTGDLVALRHEAVQRAWSSHGVSRGRSALALGASFAFTGYLLGGGFRSGDVTTRDRTIGTAVGVGVGVLLGIIRPFETWRRVRR